MPFLIFFFLLFIFFFFPKGELPDHLLDVIEYPGPGYCIFMQGSRIAHAVTPVTSAREERLTLVNSFQSLQPFDEDRTIFQTFHRIDGNAPIMEFAKHQAWRASGKLDYLLNRANYFGKTKEITTVLELAIADLKKAKDLINGKVVEKLPWALSEEITHKGKKSEEDGDGGGKGGRQSKL